MERSPTPHRYGSFMRRYMENPFLLLFLRLVVGLVFVVASVEKTADPAAFGASISNYRILPESIVLIPATFLPWMELLCGLSLFFGILSRGSSLLGASVLVVFTIAVLSALARGLDITCGCFTQTAGADLIGWWKIAENAGLILACLLILRGGEGALSLGAYLRRRPEG